MPGSMSALYTSLDRDGALAEIAYHWRLLTPPPTKPAMLHRIRVKSDKALRLKRATLSQFGIDETRFGELDYRRTQEIGSAVAFLEFDGLIAPSARWKCDHLILFSDNYSLEGDLELVGSEEVDWLAWSKDHPL